MEQDVKIPELDIFECTACGNKQVAEREAQLLCQPCVNQFLAKNVGIMQTVPRIHAVEEPPVPGPPVAEVPEVKGDGTG